MRQETNNTEEQVRKKIEQFPRWLLIRWAMGKSPEQIAQETGQSINSIYRMLIEIQKAVIDEVLLTEVQKAIIDEIPPIEAQSVIIDETLPKLARLIPISESKQLRTPGLNRGDIWTSEDFDEPLPESFWTGAV